jgi:AAA domain
LLHKSSVLFLNIDSFEEWRS